jgi:aryl-alcohol dehydrogenase-like predicted oxidoreductase
VELRNLGKSGLRVSVVGLGCNNFGGRTDLETSRKVIHHALDQGVNFLDTADSYANRGGSETVLGSVLGSRRKQVVLATKFGDQMDSAGLLKGASRRYLMSAVEASLKRLNTDWIDLYQLHFPDVLTPIEETLRTLEDLIRQGKVLYIGCSNLPAWQVADAHWTARTNGLSGFVSCQSEYNLLARAIEKELIPALQAYGMGLLPYFPLASGLLTGKYKRGVPIDPTTRFAKTPALANRFLSEANLSAVEKLAAFAAARDRPLLDLAVSWLAARPGVTSVIAGASSPEQVDANIAAVRSWLTPADLTELDALSASIQTLRLF